MNVFISYSAAVDQILALRLQTLASTYGLTVYVPPAHTRQNTTSVLGSDVQNAIRTCDMFLAVVTNTPTTATFQEVAFARGLNKLIIPIVAQTVDRNFLQSFPQVFVLDPQNPAAIEQQIVNYLMQSQTAQANRNALVALSVVAIGLLLFSETR